MQVIERVDSGRCDFNACPYVSVRDHAQDAIQVLLGCFTFMRNVINAQCICARVSIRWRLCLHATFLCILHEGGLGHSHHGKKAINEAADGINAAEMSPALVKALGVKTAAEDTGQQTNRIRQGSNTPVVVGVDGEDRALMDLAGDGVSGCDALTNPQRLGQVCRCLIAQAHLLILCPHSLPVCLQLGPLLHSHHPTT